MFTILMTISVLVKIIFFAPLVVPTVLYFMKRRESDFSRQIKLSAFVDMAFVVMLLVSVLINGLVIGWWEFPDLWPNEVIYELLYIALGLLRLFAVWKMKAGTTFGSLFKKANVNGFLFTIYLLMTAVIMVKSAIGLLNYIIFGGIALFLFWLLFVKMDILSMGFGGSGGGGSSSSSTAHQCCGSCSRYNAGDNRCNQGNRTNIEPLSDCCPQYFRR